MATLIFVFCNFTNPLKRTPPPQNISLLYVCLLTPFLYFQFSHLNNILFCNNPLSNAVALSFVSAFQSVQSASGHPSVRPPCTNSVTPNGSPWHSHRSVSVCHTKDSRRCSLTPKNCNDDVTWRSTRVSARLSFAALLPRHAYSYV
jgi:hypothetical protein